MTAEEIYEAARLRMPGIARATVYRNLGLMERDGEVQRIPRPGGPDRYDRTLAPHEHVFCPRCGAMEDLELPWLAQQVERAVGRPVSGIQLSVQALCCRCADAQAEA